uniref:Tripartite motif containing 65 n=1 Tax=Meleagris gallopavo TaxID=9103 RepID=A0A803YA04_MELGA
MASPISQKLEDKLQCSICLELFRVPVTLPCGHNFCERCIDNHRNRQEQTANGAGGGYTCPECRYICERHLELKKNVTLSDVVELARAGRGRVEGCEVRHVGLCPLHGRPLELYCEDEQRCICCVCSMRQCQRHRKALFEEEHAKKQALLERSLEEAQRETERMEQHSGPHGLPFLQDSSERLRAVILSKFTHLEEALAKFREQMVAKVEQEELVALGHIEKDWNMLKDHLEALGQHRDRAQCLLNCTDHQAFLEVPSVHPKSHIPMSLLSPDHRNLTFDPDTANKYLELSWGQRRAKHGPSAAVGWQERSRRFEPWQVLCVQSYEQGRHYWEVTISSHSVVLGVTYSEIPRHKVMGCKFNIGLDNGSWGLQVREDSYLARHNGEAEKIQLRLYTELGICLDYDQGLLSFYGLGERVQLIHSFHAFFTKPLFPVFWLCEGRTVTLCHRDCGEPEGELGQ